MGNIVDLVERDGKYVVEVNGNIIRTEDLPILISELSTAWALIAQIVPSGISVSEAPEPLRLRWHRVREGEYLGTDEETHKTYHVWTIGRFKWLGAIDGKVVTGKGSDQPMILARKRDMQRLVEAR